MKNYKLINKTTQEETICTKVIVDGFDYYVSDVTTGCKYGISKLNEIVEIKIGYDATLYKGIICTNDTNIDIPNVIDEAKELSLKMGLEFYIGGNYDFENGVRKGYNKHKETNPFSEEDMVEFLDFSINNAIRLRAVTSKELFDAWEEQKVETIYFE